MNRIISLGSIGFALTGLFVCGCHSEEVYRIRTGEYTVWRTSYDNLASVDQQEKEALQAIRLSIDRDQRLAVFTLQDGTRITVTWTLLPESEWLTVENCGADGFGVGTTTDIMEVAEINETPLVLETMVFERPALKAGCPGNTVLRLTELDHEIDSLSCSGSDKCINFLLED